VVRYTKGSRALGIGAGEYARVEQVDPLHNRLTVSTDAGQSVLYDPRRLQGVTLFREAERSFACGDRVQLTAPDRARHLANRELGTIELVNRDGSLQVRLDSSRTVSFGAGERHHLDYGYAFTSHSSQGQTADRVLVHIETERASEALVNRRLAYVALSRSRFDAHLYTDDKYQLATKLDRELSHHAALERSPVPSVLARVARGQALGLTP
jgi:ATP-dependent exoDNAse (exonuclease V) alpha subunit